MTGSTGATTDTAFEAVYSAELAGVARRAQFEAWAQSDLPVTASVALPSGLVEVRGAAGFHILCARIPADGPARCSIGELQVAMGVGDTREIMTAFTGDGRWCAVVATTMASEVPWARSTPPRDGDGRRLAHQPRAGAGGGADRARRGRDLRPAPGRRPLIRPDPRSDLGLGVRRWPSPTACGSRWRGGVCAG